MKKLVAIILLLSWNLILKAHEDAVLFTLSDDMRLLSSTLKTKIEHQVMNLLRAINEAESANTQISYDGFDIDNLASQSIDLSWSNVHFRTEDTDITECCIPLEKSDYTLRGYQVRNIGMSMRPVASTSNSELRQEICIDFSLDGHIVDFNFSMGNQLYTKLLNEGVRLRDVSQRKRIIHWCEQFKKAGIDKQLKFAEDILNSDVFVAEGEQVFLSNLHWLFSHEGYIDLIITDCEIKRHASKADFYVLTLTYKSCFSHYDNRGTIFAVWGFSNKDIPPKIHIFAWRPLNDNMD